jgi:hypothetical protein
MTRTVGIFRGCSSSSAGAFNDESFSNQISSRALTAKSYKRTRESDLLKLDGKLANLNAIVFIEHSVC